MAHPAKELGYDPWISGADAFETIFQSILEHFDSNLPVARAGDVEGLHQLRVAIRRLRAALLLFRPFLPAEETVRLRNQLRDLACLAGQARDWDVLATEILPRAQPDLTEKHVQALDRALKPVRTSAQDAVFAALGRPEVANLRIALAAFPGEVRQRPPVSPKKSLRLGIDELAPGLLDRLYRRVLKRGRKMRHASRPELHELRKTVKNLRYGIEFLAPVYGRRSKALLKPCRELQDLLGQVNDGAATPRLLQSLLGQEPEPGLSKAVAALSCWAEKREAQAYGRLAKPWRRIRQAGPFW